MLAHLAMMNQRLVVLGTVPLFLVSVAVAQDAATVDFATEIQPLIEAACLNCHNEAKAEGELRLDTRAAALEGGDSGESIVPGEPAESTFYTRTIVADDEDGIMPPTGGRLTLRQTERIKTWIAQGADWPSDAKLTVQPRINFVRQVQPILEQHCLSCHSEQKVEGDLDLSTSKTAITGGATGPAIQPFRPRESLLYTTTVAGNEADELMPPNSAGGPLGKEQTETLRRWISQGAVWPAELKLRRKAKVADRMQTPDNIALVREIHGLISQRSRESEVGAMRDYVGQIPKTATSYHMVALEGGEFVMGSPAGEAHRTVAEGPQTKIQIDPFWIGKYEVTWDEYEPYMVTQVDRRKNGSRVDYNPAVHAAADAVSQPTPPYIEMSFGMGQKGYPAISMTQHAANKYCQWLSAQTGHFYRLPTEAEWEYACRAGTDTAYSFGNDAAKIGQYAWYYENSNEKYQKVGTKKANPWGIHDMHGNVMEWTADAFDVDYFKKLQGESANPFRRPEALYPRTVRGGSWDDDAEQLRSAYRRGSEPAWKMQDPQLPKSVWYHTDAQGLGFRIVRPLRIPAVEEMDFYWNSATNKIE